MQFNIVFVAMVDSGDDHTNIIGASNNDLAGGGSQFNMAYEGDSIGDPYGMSNAIKGGTSLKTTTHNFRTFHGRK